MQFSFGGDYCENIILIQEQSEDQKDRRRNDELVFEIWNILFHITKIKSSITEVVTDD